MNYGGSDPGKALIFTFVINENGIEIYSRDFSELFFEISIFELVRWVINPSGNYIEFTVSGRTSLLKIQPLKPVDCRSIIRYLVGFIKILLDNSYYAIASQDFLDNSDEDYLPIRKDDFIYIIAKNPGNGWEYGTVDGEKKGIFPLTHIRHTPHKPNLSGRGEGVKINVTTEYVFKSLVKTFYLHLIFYRNLPLDEEIIPLLTQYAIKNFRNKKLQSEYLINLGERFVFSKVCFDFLVFLRFLFIFFCVLGSFNSFYT